MLELSDIEVRHGERTVLAIERLKLVRGTFTAIIGHNGSGKSTLMSVIARQQKPASGKIILEGADLASLSQRRLAQEIAFLPQLCPPVPGLTVRELAGLGRFAWRGALGAWRKEDRLAVATAIEETDLKAFAEELVDHLSGGERQRAWIAMLLAQEAPLLLLDEPTSALDLVHQYALMSLLSRLNREARRGVLVVLHDVNLAARFADRVIALKTGRIAFDGPADDLLSAPLLTKLYGIDIRLTTHPTGARPVAVVA
jgi:iron complex transport system ATP-binding protein